MKTFYVLMAGVLWGCISLFLTPLLGAEFSRLQIMAMRGVFSSLFMLIFILIKDRRLLKFCIKDIWMFIGTGVVSLSFFSFCYFYTIEKCGAGIGVILLYTSPVWICIMSYFLFKERFTWNKIAALVMTFAGCVLVAGFIGKGESISLAGFLIGLCAGIGYALYSIFSRYALKKYSSITVTFYTFVFSGISLLPFCGISKLPVLFHAHPESVLFVSGIAVLGTVLPYLLYTIGLSGMETGRAAILVTVEPLVGTIISFAVWKDSVTVTKVLGIVLILSAVVIQSIQLNNLRKK